MSASPAQGGYVVPCYRADDDAPWYHFLHGNVPGHQIDFLYRPEVPQGPLTRQHFSHLARLMKYIEPQREDVYAFAIGNLSRDDIQHEPGHGGLALIFGLRILGVTDHAGRRDPPFSHAAAIVDRALDAASLFTASVAFHRRVIGEAESAEWYRSYARCVSEAPAKVAEVLAGYVAGFADLPAPPPSDLGLRWVTNEAPQPKRVVLVHDDDAPFEVVAKVAARVAAVLYRSDVKWTSISNGREADLPGGVSIRVLPASCVSAADAASARRIEAVPEDEGELAWRLFGAKDALAEARAPRGWRERYSLPEVEGSVEIDVTLSDSIPPPEPPAAAQEVTPPSAEIADISAAREERPRRIETVVLAREDVERAAGPALPFAPTPAAPLVAPGDDEELATWRKRVSRGAAIWRWPAGVVALGALVVIALYMVSPEESMSPEATTLVASPPTSSAPEGPPRAAASTPVVQAPLPTATESPPTALVVGSPSNGATKSQHKETSRSKRPSVGSGKPPAPQAKSEPRAIEPVLPKVIE